MQPSSSRGATIPGLIRCFDCEAVAEALRSNIELPAPWRLDRVSISRFWPHKRNRFSFEYRLSLKGDDALARDVMVQARWCEPISRGDLRAYRIGDRQAKLTERGLEHVGIVLEPFSLVLHTPDCDRKMPWLAQAMDPTRLNAALKDRSIAELLGLNGIADAVQCDITGYRATRRCTLRYRGRQTIFAKTFRDDRGRELANRHNALADHFQRACGKSVRTPPALGYVDELRMIFLQSCDRSDSRLRIGNEPFADRAARVLVALHQAPLAIDTAHQPKDELVVCRRWAATFDALGTVDTEQFRSLAERLSREWDGDDSQMSVLVHRDFHEGQLLDDGCATALVDLDTLARGDAEVDLATFISHQLLADSGASAGHHDSMQQIAQFLSAYQRYGGSFDRRRLRCYMASALLRLGAIQLFRLPRERATDVLWRAAESVLRHSKFGDVEQLQELLRSAWPS